MHAMGVETKAETEGEAPIKMHCDHCDDTFWTDETMINDCPGCGHNSMTPA